MEQWVAMRYFRWSFAKQNMRGCGNGRAVLKGRPCRIRTNQRIRALVSLFFNYSAKQKRQRK